jgi:hypothetical protein
MTMAFKAQVKTSPALIVEVTGDNQKDLFKSVAQAMEVFGEKACGLCQSGDISLRHRVTGPKSEFDYYECACNKCGARLSYGQSGDKTSLFPKRKLLPTGEPENPKKGGGSYGQHNGWTKWRGDAKDGDA